MTIFSPTYLYIKQHTISGKLYFGKTTKSDIYAYKGSGKHWSRHIKKHGKEHVVTLWYQLYDSPFDLVADALSMSRSLDIVNSKSWLNLQEENGRDGCSSPSEETKLKISIAKKGIKKTEEAKQKMSLAQKGNKKGLGKKRSIETKIKMSASQKSLPEVKCPHCSVSSINKGAMNRWHFNNCLFKNIYHVSQTKKIHA